MKCPQIDSRVRLVHDVPDLGLTRGAVGVVCSTWFAPALTYEVEFPCNDHSLVRVLLGAEQLLVEGDPFGEVPDESELEFQPVAV